MANRIRLFAPAVIVILALPLIWAGAEQYSRNLALDDITTRSNRLVEERLLLLESELAQFRLLPAVLAEQTELQTLLSGGTVPELNDRLARIAQETGSPAIYVMDGQGRAVAASNSHLPGSFLGQDFSDRPYFREALARGRAEYLGKGLLTGNDSLFFARRTGPGVVVVKYEFEALMARWQRGEGETRLGTAGGQIFTRAGAAGPAALPVTAQRHTGAAALDLSVVLDAGPAVAAAKGQAWLLTLPAALVLSGLAALLSWGAHRRARNLAYQRELEAAVAARTADLRREMAGHARAAEAFRQAREELARANRLALLGQITAGLAHEVSQPVATIRVLSENAQRHLEAGRTPRVAEALEKAVALTARIGAILMKMRQFSQRRSAAVTSVPLVQVVEGAELILGDRLLRAGCPLPHPPEDLLVRGERIGLEQVLVNILQNAMDEIEHLPEPRLSLTWSRSSGTVDLILADNGPGLSAALQDTAFHPFATGKAEGLGLGLAIAREIMESFGGSLSFVDSPLPGAALRMRMVAA